MFIENDFNVFFCSNEIRSLNSAIYIIFNIFFLIDPLFFVSATFFFQKTAKIGNLLF